MINLPQIQELEPLSDTKLRILFLLEKLSSLDTKNLSPEERARAEDEGEDAVDDDDVVEEADADGRSRRDGLDPVRARYPIGLRVQSEENKKV